eukprot:4801086-Amphidinium_carterae.1
MSCAGGTSTLATVPYFSKCAWAPQEGMISNTSDNIMQLGMERFSTSGVTPLYPSSASAREPPLQPRRQVQESAQTDSLVVLLEGLHCFKQFHLLCFTPHLSKYLNFGLAWVCCCSTALASLFVLRMFQSKMRLYNILIDSLLKAANKHGCVPDRGRWFSPANVDVLYDNLENNSWDSQ